METKKWWKSKTLYVNVLGTIGLILAQYTDVGITGEESVGILAVINMVMRLITKTGLEA